MATVVITLTDQDNGALTLNIQSDPPLTDDDSQTYAQAAGLYAFDAANMYLSGETEEEDIPPPKGLPS